MFGNNKKILAAIAALSSTQLFVKLNQLGEQMATQAATLTDVQNSLAALTTAQQKVSTDVTAAVTDIKALSDQIAALQAAGGATPAQLADLKTSIDGITTNLQGSATSLEATLPPAPAA